MLVGIIAVVLGLLFFGTMFAVMSRYKRCPSDRILVIYGRVGKDADQVKSTAKCIHGGGAFVWPVIQNYDWLELKPISIPIELENALSRQNIRVAVPSVFTVGTSEDPKVMINAAERLLGLPESAIAKLAEEIIFGQLRTVIATMDIEEINADRDKFLQQVSENLESELAKIGLKLINVNIKDITDESGYIEALGKEATAKAINDAKVSVAEKNRDGSTGEAEANRTEEINVAGAASESQIGQSEANKNQRVQTAAFDSEAVDGENTAKIEIAESSSKRRVREAEEGKTATAAENVQKAEALEESYVAEKLAEDGRADRERSTQTANVVVPAEIAKQKLIIEADAEAENIRRVAKGEADGIYAKMEAQAKGIRDILNAQATGFEKIVEAAGGNADKAAVLMIADKIENLVETQMEAIKNIKIDNVVVWDSGKGGSGASGQPSGSTSDFFRSMYGAIPPMQDLFKMTGQQLPGWMAEQLPGSPGNDGPVTEPSRPTEPAVTAERPVKEKEEAAV